MGNPEEIQHGLTIEMPGASIRVEGDGHHFEADITWSEFAGKNTVTQHRMVYDALGDKMQRAIHALSIKTRAK